MEETLFKFLDPEEIRWRRDRLPTPGFLGFPCSSAGKESTCNAGDLCLIPGFGRSPVEGKGYPFQYSGLENSMNCIVHGFVKRQTRLSNFHCHLMVHQFSSVQFSHSVVSDSLRRHESQHARPPCPSPTPGVHPDSRPSMVHRLLLIHNTLINT